MFLHNSFSHRRLEQNESSFGPFNFGFWVKDLRDNPRYYRGEQRGYVLAVSECQKAIDKACKTLNITRFTHHDLRHLFATRCIESGVDIPTVARWLGHKDGGALLMKTYSHLLQEHSQRMAAKVSF
jgi:integrase